MLALPCRFQNGNATCFLAGQGRCARQRSSLTKPLGGAPPGGTQHAERHTQSQRPTRHAQRLCKPAAAAATDAPAAPAPNNRLPAAAVQHPRQPEEQQLELQVQSPAPARKGTVMGACALITGSTIGAGMLALPAVSAPAGILPTSAGLIAIWGLLTLDALLIAEVNLAARAARSAKAAAAAGDVGAAAPPDGGIVTLRQMAEFSLGSAGKGLTVVYLALAYSLLTAYCTKAAEVLDFFAGGGLPPLVGAALFCGAIGGLVYKEGTRAIDSLNQGLTSVLLALFAFILTAGAAQSGLPGALQTGACDFGALGPAVPILFLALVYHDLIPVIVTYLDGDRPSIRSAILLGSLVPLTMFLCWEAVALSLLPAGIADSAGSVSVLQASLQLASQPGVAGPAVLQAVPAVLGAAGSVAPPAAAAAGLGMVDAPAAAGIALDPMEVFVRRSGPLVGSVVEGFSFLAVATSFIGTTLSLSETLRTEVPPLLLEAGKLLRRSAGAEVSADMSLDDLAFLEGRGPCSGAGCSASWAGAAGDEETPQAPLGGDQCRVLALLLTLCPPLALAASNPDGFLESLQVAGGYFMTLLFGVLPPLMAWRVRAKLQSSAAEAAKAQQQQPAEAWQQAWWHQHEEMVPGGMPVLAGMFAVACGIELSQLAADAGLTGGPGNATVQGILEVALRTPSLASEAVMALLQLQPVPGL